MGTHCIEVIVEPPIEDGPAYCDIVISMLRRLRVYPVTRIIVIFEASDVTRVSPFVLTVIDELID